MFGNAKTRICRCAFFAAFGTPGAPHSRRPARPLLPAPLYRSAKQKTARRAAAFCQGYYGLELLELLPADAKEEGAYAFTLYLEREGKASLALSLVVRADGLGLQ